MVAKLKELEDKLWNSATALWGAIDPAKYKDIFLGIVFLKYLSDAFERRRNELLEETKNPNSELYCKMEEEREEIFIGHSTHIPPLIDDRVFNSNEDPIYRAFYSFDGEELLKETLASFWIYGHTHKSVNFTYGRVQLISNPIGYGIG